MPIPAYFISERKKYGAIDSPTPEMVNVKEYTCPNCGAADRERAYAIWMKRELPKNKRFTFLDVAPALPLQRFIKSTFPMINYKTGDLFMNNVDYKLDVMNMYQIPDGSVDFFICSHVLEHVRDDIQAMREFNRILSPTGKGLLIVPINLAVTEIDEDPDCTDIGERWRRFDQDDHVRRYSKQGYIQRLKSVFNVKIYDRNYFEKQAMYENGLLDTSTLYIVSKK